MRIEILTLFPEMFYGPFEHSIVKRAREGGELQLNLVNIRDYTHDKHHTVDDEPFGGGAGMVLKAGPIFEAVEAFTVNSECKPHVVLLSPQGRLFNQRIAKELSEKSHVVLICGRYEGIDSRVEENLADDVVSIGDYVLSGGEIAAMVIVDCIVRLVPGVVGSEVSVAGDTHTTGLLQYPQYTRPQTFRGWSVPEVLISGNHKEIEQWRRRQALERTLRRRPDLFQRVSLSVQDEAFVNQLRNT